LGRVLSCGNRGSLVFYLFFFFLFVIGALNHCWHALGDLLAYTACNPISLLLILIADRANGEFSLHIGGRASAALLNDVRQLVRDEFIAAGTARVILPAAEENIAAKGEGFGMEGAVEGVSSGVSVYSHLAEVGPEAGLHLPPHRVVEGLPTAARPLNLLTYLRGEQAAPAPRAIVTRLNFFPLQRLTLNDALNNAIAVCVLQGENRRRFRFVGIAEGVLQFAGLRFCRFGFQVIRLGRFSLVGRVIEPFGGGLLMGRHDGRPLWQLTLTD
jgi:hypothetical protein